MVQSGGTLSSSAWRDCNGGQGLPAGVAAALMCVQSSMAVPGPDGYGTAAQPMQAMNVLSSVRSTRKAWQMSA